ncbi:MAG: hypothetical protein ACRDVK_07205, partial [Acidimicrobiia bacterium]
MTSVPVAEPGSVGSSASQTGSVLAGGEGSSTRASCPGGRSDVASVRALRKAGDAMTQTRGGSLMIAT